jgi:hypothetical protein
MALEDILAAIRVVAAGDAMIAPGITRRLIGQFASEPRPGRSLMPKLHSELSRKLSFQRKQTHLTGRFVSITSKVSADSVATTAQDVVDACGVKGDFGQKAGGSGRWV